MLALQKPIRHKGTAVWQILFCLTLVSFLCRSVIPMGYMPDLSGGHDGGFTITLCLPGGGTNIMQVDLTDHSGQASSDDGLSSQDCPYGILVAQAAAPIHDAALPAAGIPYRSLVLPSHGNQALPPLPALGPPLGSRAPPPYLS